MIFDHPYNHVPRNESDQRALLAERPSGWEFLLFASVMLDRMTSFETQWRDYKLRYVHDIGPSIAKHALKDEISERFQVLRALLYHFNGVFDRDIHESAFGAVGVNGDPEMIVHLGSRLVEGYGNLLRWAEDVRGLRVPEGAEQVRSLLSRIVEEPLIAYRAWVLEYAQTADRIPELIQAGTRIELNLTLYLTVNEERATAIVAQLKKFLEGE